MRVDLGVRQHRVDVDGQRLVDVGFGARGRCGDGADDLILLRRAFAQPADAVGIARIHLVVAADDRVPHAVARGLRVVQIGARRDVDDVGPVDREPLDAAEEVHLVLHDRTAERAAPALILRVGLVAASSRWLGEEVLRSSGCCPGRTRRRCRACRLLPALVTALTTAPDVRPNSASNWLVMTWNSWIASIGVRACMPARCPMTSSLLLPPSTV